MKRHEWTFNYGCDTLAEAALKQADKHQTKLKWWQEQKDAVMTKIRESGIEVHESLGASYGATKMGIGPTISIEAGLERSLKECHDKITSHSRKIDEYHAWVTVLRGAHERGKDQGNIARMDLDHEDYLFFFGEYPPWKPLRAVSPARS